RGYEKEHRQPEAGVRERAPPPERCTVTPGEHQLLNGLRCSGETSEGGLACRLETVSRALLQIGGPVIQRTGNPPRQCTFFIGIHSVIPLSLSSAASVCTALEQCVLTLPSEHPIIAAVSATSMSSQ